MALLGFDAIGRLAIGQLSGAMPVYGVFATAGTGGLTAAIFVQSRSTGAFTGTASFTSMLSARASSVSSMLGGSTFAGNDHPGSVASFFGVSALTFVSYAFFADTEKAGPQYEARIASVSWETRVAVVVAEDNDYTAVAPATISILPNRKRVL